MFKLHVGDRLHGQGRVEMGLDGFNTHGLITGKIGMGKSRFSKQVILANMDAGIATIVLDPHGDLVEDILGTIASRVVETGKKTILKRVHYLEPSPFICFKYNPSRFFYPKPIHPELKESVRIAWRHAKADRLSEILQRKQGQSNFEGMPRLQRLLRSVMVAVLTEVSQKRLSLASAEVLLNPFDPRFEATVNLLEPQLPREVFADFQIIRQFRRVEELRRETESTQNRLRSVLSPLIKAILDCDEDEGIDLYQAMQQGHTVLVNLRETQFFTHDQKVALGGTIIHDVLDLTAMTPREHRKECMLFVEEAGELMSDDLPRGMGSHRKYKLRIVLVGQDLSTFRKQDTDFAPKILSQAGFIASFNMAWPDDAMTLARVIGAGNIDFTPLLQEVERHGGYEWRQVVETAINCSRQENWSESHSGSEGTSDGSSFGITDQASHSKGTQRQSGSSRGTTDTTGETESRSNSYGRSEHPIIVDGEVERRLKIGSEQTSNGTAKSEGHSDSRSFTESNALSESESFGRSLSEQLSRSRSTGRSWSRTGGGSSGAGFSVSAKWVHLPIVLRELQKTGNLEKKVSDQLEQLAQMIATLPQRHAFVKIPGQTKGIVVKTPEVKDAFVSPEALARSVEWMKRELAVVHADYHFVPQLDRDDENERLNAFLAPPHAVIDSPITVIVAQPEVSKILNPML